jgi:hypothetical protein
MLNLALDIDRKTEEKLQKILSQYRKKEVFAQNIIQYEISQLRKALLNIQIDLNKFEDKYNLSSDAFYKKFQAGELGDDEDYMLWAGIYEMFIENQNRLGELV